MRSNTIKCPNCPICGSEPVAPWPSITPWFCATEDCPVLGWDPYSSAAENLADPGEVREFIDGVEQQRD